MVVIEPQTGEQVGGFVVEKGGERVEIRSVSLGGEDGSVYVASEHEVFRVRTNVAEIVVPYSKGGKTLFPGGSCPSTVV